MTGWNLPPGVNICDIPGNRPIDALWEKEAEKFCDNCENKKDCERNLDCERSHEFERYFEDILNLRDL